MTVFEMLVAIVAILVAAGIIKAALKYKAASRLDPNQNERIDKLEARVRALEEVVGDTSYELKQKLRELEKNA